VAALKYGEEFLADFGLMSRGMRVEFGPRSHSFYLPTGLLRQPLHAGSTYTGATLQFLAEGDAHVLDEL
jgi:hypothetical protein